MNSSSSPAYITGLLLPMIARAVLRARYHGPATVSAGVGLTLAASWSTQREQRGAFERDHIVCSEGKSYTTIDSEHAMAGTAGSDKALGHEEPTLRENVRQMSHDHVRLRWGYENERYTWRWSGYLRCDGMSTRKLLNICLERERAFSSYFMNILSPIWGPFFRGPFLVQARHPS